MTRWPDSRKRLMRRLKQILAPLALVGLLSGFGAAAGAPDTPAPPAGEKAGKITALLPTAHVVRGAGTKAAITDAVKGEDLIWQDVVRTEKGGRARITLNDQSILSLGSQAELRIVKHDARAQQTTLEMTFGRVRAQVSTVTRDGGSFQVRTPTAVAGVIGTDFGTDASQPGETTFLCISGTVQVGNSDPGIPGTVPCTAGQTTTVKSGMPPTAPHPASQQQINQLITDTEPASISAFAPASALIGTTVDAVATGTHMAGVNGVSIAGGPGVQATLGGNGSETSVTAHLAISPTAPPGPRTVTFTKANGANTAAVFTVIAPPGLQGTDSASLKKRYTDILTTELQSADASNATLKAGLQQEADQGLQTIQQNAGKLLQPVSTSQVSQQLATLIANFNASGANRETQAYNTASGAVDQIVAAMVSKIQDGSEPTANIAADLDKQFAPANQAFQSALNQIHTDFAAQAATQVQSIDQLVANFQQNITVAEQQQLAPPTPKVNSQEQTVELGLPVSFDAGGSNAIAGASIAGTSWVLCDSSYKPAQTGVVLPANTPACRTVPGFAATGGQFQLNTCSLTPADYVARVTVTDTNGKSSAMDVRLHVTQPTYDDPAATLQKLAGYYIGLQTQQFLALFDATYSGYTQLQENIRNTFLNLNSMQINLRVSQASTNCNEATIRADWDQNYTFRGDQTCANAQAGSSCQRMLFHQSEQLTARMTRIPGKGWLITDFQGDNGKVQGAAPGPQTTFAPPVAGNVDLGVGSIVAPGQLIGTQAGAIDVTITNSGTVPSVASTDNLVLTSADFPTKLGSAGIPSIPASGTVSVHIPFMVPNSAGPHVVKVAITPASVGDADSGNDSATGSLNFVAGNVDLQIGALSFSKGTPPFTAGDPAEVSFTVKNAGNVPSDPSDRFNCKLSNGTASVSLGTGAVPVIGAGLSSASISFSFTVPASTVQQNFGGQSNVVCAVSRDPLENSNQTADNSSTPLAAFISTVDLAVGNITAAGQLIGTLTGTVSVSIANDGSAASVASQGSLLLSSPDFAGNLATANIPSIAAGGSVSVQLTFAVPANSPGPHKVTASISPAASGDINSANDLNTATLTFGGPDFTLANTLTQAGDLNIKVGSQGFFNVSLSEPAGATPFTVPVAVGPLIAGVNYAVLSPLTVGSSNPVGIIATSGAPAGTSVAVSVTGTAFGVSHAVTQPVRFFTASLENFSAGQPGSSQTQPIILPINGTPQPLSIRLSGNFFNPGGGAQLTFPTVTGISLTPSATTAAGGDVITLQIQAVQGAFLNLTIPLLIEAQIPNMNPPIPETLIVFVRPTALPDLAVTSVAVPGRNFSANPWLSGEPLDFAVTVANNGPGPSQGFERLHLSLNGLELTGRNVTVPQSIAPNSSLNVTVHAVAPDPVSSGAAKLTATVDEDPVGDLNPANDSLSVPIATSDWNIGIAPGTNVGDTDANALVVTAGSSNSAIIAPLLRGAGDFTTPVTVLNGIVSSRITATPGLPSFNSTQQRIRYTINANPNAAAGLYAAQLIARFVDGGRNTAQREATVHIGIQNVNRPGDTVTVVSNRNNACTAGCAAVEINGLLIENVGLTASRTGGSAGSVDLHFTDPASVISNVSSTGSFQSPILNGVPYGVAINVFFASAQDATGAVATGPAQVSVSATSIQTSAVRDGPTPQPVGGQTPLQFNVGDLQLSSVPCFNIAPGGNGVLQLNFATLSGFNVPSISWTVAALPPGVVLNSVTPSSTLSGGSYTPVSVNLTNNNPVDITPSQPFTLVGSISNNNSSATVAFAPTVQLHSGACTPGGVRNAMIEGAAAAGARGVWRRGSGSSAIARANVFRAVPASPADVRLIAGDVSYTPAMPKVGDTVQVRFRMMNAGTAEAQDVAIGLVVNGTVVVTDTFDVGAGKTTLGGLQWTNAQLPRSAIANGAMLAVLVVDPMRNVRATVASGKVAPLAHFSFAGDVSMGGAPIPGALGGRQRVLIEMAESACAGFRFSSGASGACGSGDVEISFEDAATNRFSLASTRGISDLGMANSGTAATAKAQYTQQVVAMAGHSYAVQLDSGRIGVLTIRAIGNPRQTAATANKVFRGGAGRRIARRLGKTSEPVETGDVSGAATRDSVTAVLDVLYDNP